MILIELLVKQINVVEFNIQALQNTINDLWEAAHGPEVVIVNTVMDAIDYPSDIE